MCRTRVIGNHYDPNNEISNGRGNLSFTSINLPRMAIEANHDIDKFFEILDHYTDLVVDQLYDRYLFQKKKKVRNFPFLMGQGVWIGSENLKEDDELGDIINHGTLSMGFIGLAEALIALIGKHHGESEEAQELGIKINNGKEEFTGIVLDTGSSMRTAWANGTVWLDLAFATQEEAKVAGMSSNNTQFVVQRWGW